MSRLHSPSSAAAGGGDVTTHEAAADPHPGYLTPAEANAAYSPAGHSHGSSGLEVIAEQVLASTTASLTFSSIPATFRHLRLLIAGRTDRAGLAADQVRLRFNGDTGTNYEYIETEGSGSTVTTFTSVGAAFMVVGQFTGATAPAGASGVTDLLIPHYAGTTFGKQTLSRSSLRRGASDIRRSELGGVWNSTAAISSVTVYGIANLLAGSVVTLYGMRGA